MCECEQADERPEVDEMEGLRSAVRTALRDIIMMQYALRDIVMMQYGDGDPESMSLAQVNRDIGRLRAQLGAVNDRIDLLKMLVYALAILFAWTFRALGLKFVSLLSDARG